MSRISHRASNHPSDEQCGTENTAGATGRYRKTGGNDFGQRNRNHDSDTKFPQNSQLDPAPAVTVNLRKDKTDASHNQTAQCRFNVAGDLQGLENALSHAVKYLDEKNPGGHTDQSQKHIKDQLAGIGKCILRKKENRRIAEEICKNDIGGNGADHRGHKGFCFHVFLVKDFNGRERAAQRSTENRRQTTSAACQEKDTTLAVTQS